MRPFTEGYSAYVKERALFGSCQHVGIEKEAWEEGWLTAAETHMMGATWNELHVAANAQEASG